MLKAIFFLLFSVSSGETSQVVHASESPSTPVNNDTIATSTFSGYGESVTFLIYLVRVNV